jgi:hypothetical protein
MLGEAATLSTPAAVPGAAAPLGSLAPSTPAKVDATPFTRPGEMLSPVTSTALPAEPSEAATQSTEHSIATLHAAANAAPATPSPSQLAATPPTARTITQDACGDGVSARASPAQPPPSATTGSRAAPAGPSPRVDLSGLKLDLSTLPVPLAALTTALLGGLLMLLKARSSRPRFTEVCAQTCLANMPPRVHLHGESRSCQ